MTIARVHNWSSKTVAAITDATRVAIQIAAFISQTDGHTRTDANSLGRAVAIEFLGGVGRKLVDDNHV